ncbi:MAG: 5-formyltetrahydrofolate cyclo-ligase [Gammaproteobacteria bacterium]|nr:5-formyltetrahydrofolate cyclo-ligase [Gammaproteobacteria bacterium]
MKSSTDKKRQRRELRSRRGEISPREQAHASRRVAVQARGYRQLWAGKRLLSYSPFQGEIDPGPLVAALNSEIFLPRIINYRNRAMQFLKKEKTKHLSPYGISEPSLASARLSARHFDAVLVPLVGFDRNGNRLGMGAGYYDRSFSFRLRQDTPRRPLLVGLAHHFQEVNQLPTNSWDVGLDAIITDLELIII